MSFRNLGGQSTRPRRGMIVTLAAALALVVSGTATAQSAVEQVSQADIDAAMADAHRR